MKSVVLYYRQSYIVKHNCNNRVRGWATDINTVIMCYPSPFRVKPRLDPSSCGVLTITHPGHWSGLSLFNGGSLLREDPSQGGRLHPTFVVPIRCIDTRCLPPTRTGRPILKSYCRVIQYGSSP